MKQRNLLSDSDLLEGTKKAVANEKSATLDVLEHFAEVERRRLYASRGYSSLWEFAMKVHGYSDWQANERIAAMRLMVKVPEVKKEIEAGRLNLTATAQLGKHVRRENLKQAEAMALLSEIQTKATRDIERVLVADSCERHPEKAHLFEAKQSVKPITKDLTRITIDVDQEFLDLMQRVKELKGNPSSRPQEIFMAAMKEFIGKREPKTETRKPINTTATLGALGEHGGKQTRYIKKSDRMTVRTRSGDRCEFVDRASGRRCEERHGLQFDHIRPFALDGRSEADNLRHYCPAHNRLAAVQTFGKEKMREYLN